MAEDREEYEGYEEEEELEEQQEGTLPSWLSDAPWWAISAVLHLVILVLIGGLVITSSKAEETAETAMMKKEYKPPPYDPTKKRAMHRKSGVVNKKKKKLVKRLKPQEIAHEIPKGTSWDNMADKNLKHTGAVDVFGMGGGAAGAYGSRFGKGGLYSGGGGEATESAVRAALEWLKRHQNPDGSWSGHDFTEQCDDKGPCELRDKNEKMDWLNTGGQGWKGHDIGVTALAVLAYTGFGITHTTGTYPDYVEVVRKALQYLKSVQISGTGDPRYDGCFREKSSIPEDASEEAKVDEQQEWIYDHSIATMAVAELLVLSGDTIGLKRCVEDAADFCIRAQNPGWGWRYSVRAGDNDTSVTGWMVLALKTVKACKNLGLVTTPTDSELKKSFEGAVKCFDYATTSTTGRTGYTSPGDEGSQLRELDNVEGGYPYSKKLSCMTAVSVLCRLFAGERRSKDVIKKGVMNILMKHKPEWRIRKEGDLSTINFYYWYYASFAMYQYGGRLWKEWNKSMQDALLPPQRRVGDTATGGCEDGSWDPIGEWGVAGGRVYSTAMGALTLEVYYRYERAEGGKGY